MAILDKIKKTVKKDETKKTAVAVKSEKSVAKSVDVVYHDILKAPYITEKTAMMGQQNKYAFKVSKNTNKIDVRRAVEAIFEVKVVSVAMLNTASKNVRLGRHEGKKSGFKKAIVKLKEGDKIDIGI